MFKKLAVAALVAFALPAASQAQIAGNTNRACTLGDVLGGGIVSVSNCSGFWSGNLLSGSPADVTAQNSALNAMLGTVGTNYYGNQLQNIGSLGGSSSVNFTSLLTGITVIGIHWGEGAQIFGGDPNYNGNGGGTSFYVFNAGAGVDVFNLRAPALANGSSGATLYSTGGGCGTAEVGACGTVVPEPSTYALMATGLLGLFGFARRRRNA